MNRKEINMDTYNKFKSSRKNGTISPGTAMDKLSDKELAQARVKARVNCSMVAGHVCNPLIVPGKEDPLCLACLEGDREQILKMQEGGENVE